MAGLSSTGQQFGPQIWLVTETQQWRHTWDLNKTKNRVYDAAIYVQFKGHTQTDATQLQGTSQRMGVACERCGGGVSGECGQERGPARADGEFVVTGYTHMQTHTRTHTHTHTDTHAQTSMQRKKRREKRKRERERRHFLSLTCSKTVPELQRPV